MIHITISPEFEKKINPDLLEKAAMETLLQTSGNSTAELSIVIENNEAVRKLNHKFRAIDSPTDVLSFPAEEIDPDNGTRYIGDVIISYEQVCFQAEVFKHDVRDELLLLVIHGVLHLLGHDHLNNDQKLQMWKIQDNILKTLDCVIQSPP